ncbi:MAG: hypothetical protein M3010_10635, partial [Candidatus Dormibacteraeota bacterium]|nr:hypothetical protein [Candidatus Dormibacteraeota bacterium]
DTSTPGTTPALALWMVAADGRGRHKIQDLLPARPVDTAPGGADQDLLQALTTMQEPTWSPDGNRVAFVSAHEDEVDLYTATRDGQVTRLTQTDSLKKSPRWSLDGRFVACMTTSGFGTGAGWDSAGVIVAPADGSAAAQDYGDLKLPGGQPATLLADLIWTGPDTLVSGLEAVVPGGVEIAALTASSGTWTPILSVAAGGEAGLWWSAADGTLAIAVTPGNGDGTPAPADAGLYTWKPGTARAIQVTGATVGPIALSPQQTMDPVGPVAWRPQGGLLAYNIQEGGAQLGVHLWPASGKPGGPAISSGSVDDVVWAPDGQRLAANGDIYQPDGHKVETLPGANALLGWAAQGIFFTTPENGSGGNDTSKLWIWKAGAAQAIDAGLAGSVWGKVVVPQP